MVTAIVTLLAIGILIVFFVSAIPFFDFGKYAMNIGADPSTGAAVELPDGHGPFLPFGVHGILASLPFAVWLFLAIEQLPLAAEESADPKRDMPKGIMLGMFTLIALGFLVLLFNPAIPIARDVTDAAGVPTVHGAFALGTSGEPILDGFRAIFGSNWAKALALIAVTGLVASFHAIIFAYGRQIYSLSRAGYFPHFLSVTHGTHKTPNIALVAGGVLGLAVMLVVWFAMGGDAAGSFIGGVLLNMAVFGAMFSYLLQGLTFIQLRRTLPQNRAAVSQPVRRARGDADGDHRARDHRLPARRSGIPHRRDRRGDLVCPRHPLLRALCPEAHDPVAGRGVRDGTSRERLTRSISCQPQTG